MTSVSSVRGKVLAVAVVMLACGPAHAQRPARARPLENVRLLKGWTNDDVRAEMRLWTEALGVTCEHCHVQGNLASDEKRTKRTARTMVELTQSLNAEHFSGVAPIEGASRLGRVTCFTCHRGATTPKTSEGDGGERR